ncbi:uncharacterized protein LOC116952123 [Tachysurus ichikawai]
MRDANIVTLYKNKEDHSDCNNYRGIPLFSIVGKAFERQLQEKCREQQMPLYIAFIDLTKAFDLVSRSGLFRLLEKYAFKDCSEDVYIHTRTDGKLFNIARLRAKTKVTEVLICELLFADDAALTSHTEDGLQKLVCRLSHACKEIRLTISLKKTNVMVQDADSPPTIAIEGGRTKYQTQRFWNAPGMNSMFSIFSERRLRWLGHVRRMDPGRIPKDLQYGELPEGARLTGRPRLRYKEVCKKDMKMANINVNNWESYADDRPAQKAEKVRNTNLAKKRARRKANQQQPQQASAFTCSKCNRDCHSRIGLFSHSRRCR